MGRRSRLRFWSRSPKPPQSQPTTSTTARPEPSLSAPVNPNEVIRVSLSPTDQVKIPSLWQKAYAQLDAELVAQFNELLHQEAPRTDSSETGYNDPTRDEVDRICQDGKRRMEQAETTFRFNNKEHKAHDVFVKGLGVITWAKDLVSTALGTASSPEVSLAWAAAILVLPLFENIGTVKEANETGFTYVTASMKFYIALETEFRSLGSSVSQDLVDATEESIVDLYRNILNFQIRSAIRFNRNKVKNKFRDVVEYDGWKELLQSVKDAESLVNQRWELLQSTIGSHKLQSLREEAAGNLRILQKHLEDLKNISKNTDEMVEMMKKSESRAVSEAEQKYLQALRHHSATEDQSYELAKDRTEKRVDGTCKWLLADEQYQAWLRTNSGLLVISADPGCGKSVLSRYLIEEGLPRDDLTICYFFFKDEDQDRVHLALCALLHQLLVSKPFLITKYLAPEHSKDGESLKTNVSVLWKILQSALRDPWTGEVVIVVDGLDECKPEQLGDFSDKVNSLFCKTEPTQQTKFIVTTRPYDQIMSRFNARPIRVAGELESGTIREEVKLVIQHRIKILRKMPQIISNDLIPYLEEQLLNIDHPTYLWAALTFKFIESGRFKKTKRGLREAVTRLPRTINEAYEKILRKTDPEDKVIVRRALTIVLGAKRPMYIDEMNVALNLSPDMTSLDELDLEGDDDFTISLRNWTGLFITIYNNQVYFLHQTVREFLVGDSSSSAVDTSGPDRWHGAFSPCEAHKMIAGIFLQYIPLYYNFHTPGTMMGTAPLASMYSVATYFIEDYLTDEVGDKVLELAAHVLARFGRDWTDPLDYPPDSWTDHELALLLAAWNCLSSVVDYLLSSPGVDLECCDGMGQTPLVLALPRVSGCKRRSLHRNAISMVLRTSRKITFAESAIAWALLEAGANPNPKLGTGLHLPIVTATCCRDVSMVAKLIMHGACVDAQDQYGVTPLHYASDENSEEAAALLISHGARVDARDHHGCTPLHYVSDEYSKEVAEVLISHGANVDAQDQDGCTPLHYAAARDKGDIAKLLISSGAQIDAIDSAGQTPLMVAKKSYATEVLAILKESEV